MGRPPADKGVLTADGRPFRRRAGSVLAPGMRGGWQSLRLKLFESAFGLCVLAI